MATKYRLTFTLGHVSTTSGPSLSSNAQLNALSGELWEAGYADCRACCLEPTSVVVVTGEADSLGAAVGAALEDIARAGYLVPRVSDLEEAEGFGEKKMEELRPLIRVR